MPHPYQPRPAADFHPQEPPENRTPSRTPSPEALPVQRPTPAHASSDGPIDGFSSTHGKVVPGSFKYEEGTGKARKCYFEVKPDWPLARSVENIKVVDNVAKEAVDREGRPYPDNECVIVRYIGGYRGTIHSVWKPEEYEAKFGTKAAGG